MLRQPCLAGRSAHQCMGSHGSSRPNERDCFLISASMSETARIVESFRVNAEGVGKLIHFDREILGVAVSQIEELHERLLKGGFPNPALNAQNTLTMMRAVRDNDSLK